MSLKRGAEVRGKPDSNFPGVRMKVTRVGLGTVTVELLEVSAVQRAWSVGDKVVLNQWEVEAVDGK